MKKLKKIIPTRIKSIIRNRIIKTIRILGLSPDTASRAAVELEAQQRKIVSKSIEVANDPIEYLNILTEDLSVTPKAIWLAISDLYAASSPVTSTLQVRTNSIANFYIRNQVSIRKTHLAPGLISPETFSELVAGCELNSDDLISVMRLKTQLASIAIAKLPCRDIEFALRSLPIEPITLTHTQKIKLIHRKIVGGQWELAEEYKNKFSSSLDELEILKILILEQAAGLKPSSSYQELEEKFTSIRHQVAVAYAQHLKERLSRIPANENFLDARVNQTKREVIKGLILKHLLDKKPFSFIRLSDGECYGFSDSRFLSEDAYTRQELHWWGEALPKTLRKELQENFRSSISSANLIGIPTLFRLSSAIYMSKDAPPPRNSVLARVFSVARNGLDFLPQGKLFVEEQSNLFLFDKSFLESLIRAASKVVIISGLRATSLRQLPIFAQTSEPTFIELPTHRLLREHSISSDSQEILPFSYSKYLSAIERLAAPGALVLVSGGFIGKHLIASAASRGAVALDVGQQLIHLLNEAKKNETR